MGRKPTGGHAALVNSFLRFTDGETARTNVVEKRHPSNRESGIEREKQNLFIIVKQQHDAQVYPAVASQNPRRLNWGNVYCSA